MQMKKVEEMTRLAYAAKLDLMVGLKQMEISRCKELFGKQWPCLKLQIMSFPV